MKKWFCLVALLILSVSCHWQSESVFEKFDVAKIVTSERSGFTFFLEKDNQLIPVKFRYIQGELKIYQDVPAGDKNWIKVGLPQYQIDIFKKYLYKAFPDPLAVRSLEVHIHSLDDIGH